MPSFFKKNEDPIAAADIKQHEPMVYDEIFALGKVEGNTEGHAAGLAEAKESTDADTATLEAAAEKKGAEAEVARINAIVEVAPDALKSKAVELAVAGKSLEDAKTDLLKEGGSMLENNKALQTLRSETAAPAKQEDGNKADVMPVLDGLSKEDQEKKLGEIWDSNQACHEGHISKEGFIAANIVK